MKVPGCVLVVAFASAVSAADAPQSSVSSRRLSDSLYELTVTLQNTTDVLTAQRLLLPEAKKICGGQPFDFGHYSFNSTERIGDSDASESPHLTLRQEVTCGPSSAPSNPHTSYEWSPAVADSQLVAARTAEYLLKRIMASWPLPTAN